MESLVCLCSHWSDLTSFTLWMTEPWSLWLFSQQPVFLHCHFRSFLSSSVNTDHRVCLHFCERGLTPHPSPSPLVFLQNGWLSVWISFLLNLNTGKAYSVLSVYILVHKLHLYFVYMINEIIFLLTPGLWSFFCVVTIIVFSLKNKQTFNQLKGDWRLRSD